MKFKIIAILFIAVTAAVYSCQSDEKLEFMRYYTTGQELYKTRCQNCHGAQGEGLAALIPPLTDSIYLKTNRNKLACYVKNGLKLPIMVNGKPFNGEMPPSGLAPVEIAQVLTYVQNNFGNHLGLHSVEKVNKELESCN
ncbi:c-type cytochrome [Mucilaginibacter aquatilis]|uniref:C-type cytochrome n=1 Tax=Mucilaginibacter aquatilis TaxID=1517760 RepID=A0A6I4IQ51_9SPHI|nr:cytochrome c [Mucilaginibacter aquatilis]MVN91123.1 c-type cytochrome [Mucilaginibacter aquatilis]